MQILAKYDGSCYKGKEMQLKKYTICTSGIYVKEQQRKKWMLEYKQTKPIWNCRTVNSGIVDVSYIVPHRHNLWPRHTWMGKTKMPSSVGKLLFRQFELTEIHVQLKMFTVCCKKEKERCFCLFRNRHSSFKPCSTYLDFSSHQCQWWQTARDIKGTMFLAQYLLFCLFFESHHSVLVNFITQAFYSLHMLPTYTHDGTYATENITSSWCQYCWESLWEPLHRSHFLTSTPTLCQLQPCYCPDTSKLSVTVLWEGDIWKTIVLYHDKSILRDLTKLRTLFFQHYPPRWSQITLLDFGFFFFFFLVGYYSVLFSTATLVCLSLTSEKMSFSTSHHFIIWAISQRAV